MAHTNEEIKVGVVVFLAGILFLSSLVFVGGVNLFRKRTVAYTTYFKFAGGLEPGAVVRFGGLKVGNVQSARIDPQDSTRIRVTLQLAGDTPIRANSKARISTLGFLGENYIEISPGTREARRLPPGNEIPSVEIVQIADVFTNVNNITVNANKLVSDLDDRVLVLADNIAELIKNVNEVVSPQNRAHFNAVLANADSLLAESRPRVNNTLANLEATSAKLAPAVDNANAAIGKTDALVGHLDTVVQENRQEVHEVLLRLKVSLADTQRAINDLDDTLQDNRGNLDETLDNLRVSSQNLKQFTDTVKRRPFSLIRIKTEKDRLPPTGK